MYKKQVPAVAYAPNTLRVILDRGNVAFTLFFEYGVFFAIGCYGLQSFFFLYKFSTTRFKAKAKRNSFRSLKRSLALREPYSPFQSQFELTYDGHPDQVETT